MKQFIGTKVSTVFSVHSILYLNRETKWKGSIKNTKKRDQTKATLHILKFILKGKKCKDDRQSVTDETERRT